MKLRLVISLALLVNCANAQSSHKFLKSELAAAKKLPFSSGVVAGNTLYVAGTAASPDQLASGLTPEQEAKSIMEQIKHTVESAGMTMGDIVSVQVFCTDLALYDAFNRVYSSYFNGDYPARAFIGASKLLFGARYEVMAIAVKSEPGGLSSGQAR